MSAHIQAEPVVGGDAGIRASRALAAQKKRSDCCAREASTWILRSCLSPLVQELATEYSTESLIPNPFGQTYDTLYYDNALWNDLEQKRLTDGVNGSMHIVQNE